MWARERCNDFFIERSKNGNLTDCPNGPLELRRAFHRHPYRGAQKCDACKKASRKDSKVVQLARQKANVALGERPEYVGALFLGELEIPDEFHEAHLLRRGEVDAMRSSWESFSLANGHLPSHELEREWATRFSAFNVGLNAGVRTESSSKLAPTFGQRMSGEDDNRGMTAAADETSRSLRQQTGTIVDEAASQDTHDQDFYKISSWTNSSTYTTAEESGAPQEPHREAHDNSNDSNSATGSSSSQSTRARPWDL